MRKVLTTAVLLLALDLTLLAQQPVVTIIPLVVGTPLYRTTVQDVHSLETLQSDLKAQTLEILKKVDINPDSCEFISTKENIRYSSKIGKLDICYNYCKILYDHGNVQSSASIHYNGFTINLKKPKLHIMFLQSSDKEIQEVVVHYYRGLPAELMGK